MADRAVRGSLALVGRLALGLFDSDRTLERVETKAHDRMWPWRFTRGDASPIWLLRACFG